MNRENIKKQVELLNVDVKHIDVDDLIFHLKKLEANIKLIDNLENLYRYEPTFFLEKSSDSSC